MNFRDIIGFQTDAIPGRSASVTTGLSIMQVAKALMDRVGVAEPSPFGAAASPFVSTIYEHLLATKKSAQSFAETWQDETGIDAGVWAVTDPATGAAWSRGASGHYLRAISSPNASENCRLVSLRRWQCSPTYFAHPRACNKRFFLEFEIWLTNPANMNNGTCFWGLTQAPGDDRSTNNIIGFGLNMMNEWECILDAVGMENTHNTMVNPTTKNRFGVAIAGNLVEFYVNGGISHIVGTGQDMSPGYLNFYTETGAAGAATVETGIIRCWHSDL